MALAIPKGSIILVTGVNGFIGSHVADQFLEAGYRVRGTAREISKAEGLQHLLGKKYGLDKFEVVAVPDMAKEGAFDEAVKGVAGIAHTASNMTFNHDPNAVIPEVLSGINNILLSAASSPTVKRFVYTSSSTAATKPYANKEFLITTDTWNEDDIRDAWAPPPYKQERALAVYGASKTLAEKAVWDFVKEKKPQFTCNTVLPNCNFGKILVFGQSASTGDFITGLYKGEIGMLKHFSPQWFVDVQDTARLHVAALTNPEVNNERLFAFSEPFNFNDVLRILRKLRPDHPFPDNFHDDNVRDLSKVHNERAAELLRTFPGRDGFTGLEESLRNNIADL